MKAIEEKLQDVIWELIQEKKEINRDDAEQDLKHYKIEGIIQALDNVHTDIQKL